MLALALTSMPLHAQHLPDSLAGHRVRIRLVRQPFSAEGNAPGQVLRGAIVRVLPDSIRLRLHPSAGVLGVATPAIDRLEVSHGVRSRAAGAVGGAVGGGLFFGFVWWAFDSNRRDRVLHSDLQDWAVGAAVGAVLGAIGGATRPLERWQRVRLR
jgi:hypothetical protein